MPDRILKLNFLGSVVELRIGDVDKCLMIDVLNDMCDEFEKKGYELPEFPVLHYGFKGVSNYLTDDGSLMKMFENVKSTVIDVWVGCLEEPNFIWTLAQNLRSQNQSKPQSKPPSKPTSKSPQKQPRISKLPIKRPPKPTQSSLNQNPSPPLTANPRVVTSPRRSPRFRGLQDPEVILLGSNDVQSSINLTPPSASATFTPSQPKVNSMTQPSSSSQPKQTKPPPQKNSRNLTPPSAPVTFTPSQTNVNQMTQPNSSSQPKQTNPQPPKSTNNPLKARPVSFPHGKKMCRTLAVKRGLWNSRGERVQAQPEVQGGRLRTRLVGGLEEIEGESHSSSTDSESDSEGEYEPEVSEVESEEMGDDEFDEGDIGELLNQNYVDGGWDPMKKSDYVSEDMSYLGKVFKNGEVYDDAEMGKIRLKVWQLFVDREHFKDVLRDFCVQEGFALLVDKTDHIRHRAYCADARCGWKIHASVLPDGYTWAIKKMSKKHDCDCNLVNNPMVTCDWAAKKLLEDIKANPDIRGKAINALLWERYGVTMATSTIYRMKSIALQMIQGGHDDSYTNLPQYCELLKSCNPCSVAFCTWRELEQPQKSLQFTSIFISFAAQFRGVIGGCRGLVGVDGCHLKGNYGGILLSAVSLDGNNEIFPVAVAVVDSENKTSWTWFFDLLKKILLESGREDWCIMSDRQKGIDPALDSVWPKVDRRYCARHLCANFKTEYPGLMMHKLFWGVTNAYSQFTFRKALQQVQMHAGLGAVKWFKEIGPLERWTRWRFDPNLGQDENTNNFVESFNSTIGIDRTNPILTLLEGVRRVAMVRHATRQQLAEQWPDDGVCPNILSMLRVLTKDSRFCQAYPSGRGTYEIHDGRARLPLSLNARTCACGRWQISGIPCKHAIKAILHEGKQPTEYVSDWFSVARYKQAYLGNIAPVPDPDQWPINNDLPTLIPPAMKRSVGRPSRNRKREEHEQRKGKRSITVTCSKCKGFGHNAATCKGGNTARELAEAQGEGKAVKKNKSSKKLKNVVYGQLDSSLIEALIEGTADQWVDPFGSTDLGEQSQRGETSTQIQTETEVGGRKKGKKRKNKSQAEAPTFEDFDNYHGIDDNFINSMISESQPQMRQATTSQPSQHQHSSSQPPLPTSPIMTQPMSPKTAKILRRLQNLN